MLDPCDWIVVEFPYDRDPQGSSAIHLPEAIIDWLEDNVSLTLRYRHSGESSMWYHHSFQTRNRQVYHKIAFKQAHHALMFKLAWGGNG